MRINLSMINSTFLIRMKSNYLHAIYYPTLLHLEELVSKLLSTTKDMYIEIICLKKFDTWMDL